MLPKLDGPLHPDGSFSQAHPRNCRVVPSNRRPQLQARGTGARDRYPGLVYSAGNWQNCSQKLMFSSNRAAIPSLTAPDWHHKPIDHQ
jgi:hypothetical protein